MALLGLLKSELESRANSETAVVLRRFFKTGPGEYGEGDLFLGIKVPELRNLSKKYHNLQLVNVSTLIKSLIHEERFTALLILLERYKQAKETCVRETIYDFYIANMRYINNWDLVDISAPHIVGHYLFDKDKSVLTSWAQDKNLWARRIAIIATFYFIRQNAFQDTLAIAFILLNDKEDLIHKAVGWMLREISKRHLLTAEKFLVEHYKIMPRTMLRYAIERFPEIKRQAYLKGKI